MRIANLVLALAVCLGAGVGGGAVACAAAPDRDQARDIFLTPDTTIVRGLVEDATTLDAMLRAHGLAADAVVAVIEAARTVFDPRRLRASQPFMLERTLEGALRHFEYEIDNDSFLRVMPAGGGTALHAVVLPIPKTVEHALASGAIDEETPSLFQAMEAAGEGAELTIALAQIFAGEIDFNTELQPGDRFSLAFERFAREGRPSTYGTITAAEIENEGRLVRGIRFTPPGGMPGYFDEQGRSLRRFFLRSPLKFEPRITSRYSLRRMHPVLHTTRAHRGIDYGAVANGSIVLATYDDANGRMVRLRHASGYDSYYLHLLAFAPAIRRGARVTQGQTIGLVGSTGLATGPHLHYGLQKDGGWVDPLREHRNVPPGEPVPAAAMEAFLAARDAALGRLGRADDERTPSPRRSSGQAVAAESATYSK